MTGYGYRRESADLGPLGESVHGGQMVASVLEYRISYRILSSGQHVETSRAIHATGKMAIALPAVTA